jgi:hypothetical protein
LILLMFCAFAFAAGPKSYQITGPVLEIKDDVIVKRRNKSLRTARGRKAVKACRGAAFS